MSDLFDLARVDAALDGSVFAGRVQHLTSAGSTNALALEAAQAGAPHGSVWIADEQTAGRGRGGHTWHSRAGDGLYTSILLRPVMPLQQALWLSLATGLAVQAAIANVTGIRPDIRWPNDLLLGGKKCCGILVETATTPSASEGPAMIRYAVVGIGINVNHAEFPEELTALATSLYRETGRAWRREDLLAELLVRLEEQVGLLEAELAGTAGTGLLKRFAEGSTWVRGMRVRVEEGGGYTGVTAGLNTQGFLQVDGDDGVRRTVLSGGVRPL